MHPADEAQKFTRRHDLALGLGLRACLSRRKARSIRPTAILTSFTPTRAGPLATARIFFSGNPQTAAQAGVPPSGFMVPALPDQGQAAMTDSTGPGSHILFQDFVVPAGITAATLHFERFIGNRAGSFFTPATLNFTGVPNQQARIDIIPTAANPFSVAATDVLLNIFKSTGRLISGYTTQTVDLTSFLAAHAGETLRLRFAEVDNQGSFQFGVDDIVLAVNSSPGGAAVPGRGRTNAGQPPLAPPVFGHGGTLPRDPSETGTALALPPLRFPYPLLPSASDLDQFFRSTIHTCEERFCTHHPSEQGELIGAGQWHDEMLAKIFGKDGSPVEQYLVGGFWATRSRRPTSIAS